MSNRRTLLTPCLLTAHIQRLPESFLCCVCPGRDLSAIACLGRRICRMCCLFTSRSCPRPYVFNRHTNWPPHLFDVVFAGRCIRYPSHFVEAASVGRRSCRWLRRSLVGHVPRPYVRRRLCSPPAPIRVLISYLTRP
jgi:hypothetical protein